MEKPKRLGDIPVVGFYPDAAQTELEDILDQEIEILDMTLITNEMGDFAVFSFKKPGEETLYSSACGGYKVVQRLVQAKEQGWFPLPANIYKEGRRYEVK